MRLGSPAGGESEAEPPTPLLSALARGSGWIVGGTYAARALGLVSTLVVARLLTPEDFGVFAVGLVFLQMLVGFTEVGLNLAVVRFRDASDAEMDTLFTLSLLRGVLLAALMAAAGPVMAALYGDARLVSVFLGLAVVPLLTGLINPRFYEFERAGDFSREFVVVLASKLGSVAMTIGLALLLGSYWAIIAGQIAAAMMQAALSYALRPTAPRLTLAAFARVFGFTGWITAVAIFAALNNKLDAMIFGKLIGKPAAGQLYVGSQLAELPTRDVSVPLARALFPSLSARQGDPEAVRLAYLRGCEVLGAVALPSSVGFALVAPHAVPLLVGHQWDAAIPVVQLVGPVLGLQTVFAATQGYAMALGRVGVVAAREAAFFCLRTPTILLALRWHGFTAGVMAVAAMGLLHCLLNMAVYARLSGRPFWEPLQAGARGLLATSVMAGAVLAADLALADRLPPLPETALLIVVGALAYAATLGLAWHASGRPAGVESAGASLAARLTGARARGA